MNPQNVLFLVPRMPIGGAETFLINILKTIDRERITPILISLGSTDDPLYGRVPEGITKFVFPRKWRFDLSPCNSIKKIINDYNIKAGIAVDYFTYFFLRHSIHKGKLDVRNITLLHSTKPRYVKEYIQGFIFARLLSGGEEVVTTCINQREYLRRLFMIPNSRLKTVVYNGIDTDFWSLPPSTYDQRSQRKKLGIPDDAIVIINVAGFRREKRHDIIIRAFGILSGRMKPREVFILFVGGGDPAIETEMKQLVKDSNLTKNALFMGVQEDLRSMYWLADLFTLGSTSETFSIAALEAMSTGLPAVLTDVGGANEMITEGVNGCLAQPGSPDSLALAWMKCVELLPTLKHENIRSNVVSRFDIRKCVRGYEDYILNSK